MLASLVVGPDLRVEQEGMVAAVPGDVHETDKRTAVVPRSQPSEAVSRDAVPPPGPSCSAMRSGQR